MISVEAWTTIRYLKAQGLGTRKIAVQAGVARNTVKRAIRSEGPPKYERPPRPNPKLEPLRDVIRRMLTIKVLTLVEIVGNMNLNRYT